MPEYASIDNLYVFWSFALASALLVGFSKSGMLGAGTLAIPLMATIFPAKSSPGIFLPMLIAGDIFAVMYYKRHAVWPHVLGALTWVLPGIITGWLLVKYIPMDQAMFKRVIGLIVLFVLAGDIFLRRYRDRLGEKLPKHWAPAIFVGFFGGITTMAANAAGPLFMVYLLMLDLPKKNFVGTAAWIFLILNLCKVPFSANLGFITAETLIFDAKMVPFIGLGALAGIFFLNRIPQKYFSATVRVLVFVAALNLLR